MQRTIGILAGMGPKSTAPFIDQVVSQFQSIKDVKDDIDFPPMMIYSLPTPFYTDRPVDHELMKRTICDGLKRLEACGVAYIAMPCNTAHIYFESLEHCVQVPLLNMVEITLRAMPTIAKKVAILGTRSTIDADIYQKGLERIGLHSAWQPKWQMLVDDLITKIKIGTEFSILEKLWSRLLNELHISHVDTILLACTDLNVVSRKSTIPIIDSSLCLAKEVVRAW